MRPAEIRRYVHVPDLTAAAVGAVIVCVLPSAVGTDGTVVVHVAAELADVLDHHVHAVGVTLAQMAAAGVVRPPAAERSEEHKSELQSLMRISYAVLCLKKKNKKHQTNTIQTHKIQIRSQT